MKKYLLFCLIFAGLHISKNCFAQKNQFGTKIDDKGAITVSELATKIEGKQEMNAKVVGKVTDVCHAKGCWMTLDKGDGSTMRVTFKDYAFFVPKDLAGKTVVIQGKAEMTTTTVSELKHYAEDAGKSAAEIEKITEPTKELAFEADGVLIK